MSHPLVTVCWSGSRWAEPKEATVTEGFVISCADCVMRETDACSECVVSFICGRDDDDAVVIDAAEVRAVRLLARAGLTPPLRHASRSG